MKQKLLLAALMGAISAAGLPALAGDIMITDAYARASTPMARSGAAFMTIMNHGDSDDRLVAVASDAAARAELHTHIDAGDGVMQMRHDEDGFGIPAGGAHRLARGGDHVMLMGLTGPLAHGAEIELTLTFESAGEMTVTVPVDLERKPDEGASMDHGSMDHGSDAE